MDEYYPGLTEPIRNDTIAIGVTSVSVCNGRNEANQRKMFLIRNTSTDVTMIITLHLGPGAAVANQGIVLRQNDSYLEANDVGFKCWNDSIQAICAVAAGQISVVER